MSDDWIKRQRTRLRAANENAERIYQALKSTGGLADQRLISYRCAVRRCLLLEVFQVPGQVLAHQPAYRLSPRVNAETSSESGRARNTVDGERRWRAHTYDVAVALNFTLNCDHLHHLVLEKAEVQADLDARHAGVLITTTGERRPIG